MSAPLVFILSAAGAGNGVYTGTFPGGAGNAYAGMWVVIAGFDNLANNGTFLVTASGATTITTANAASVAENHAGTATDFTPYASLDPGGFPLTVVDTATGTGSTFSRRFSTLCRPDGRSRVVTLQLGTVVGAVSALVVSVLQSFDGGLNWKITQSNIDLFNSPSQVVSPDPSAGAIIKINVDTLTGGTSASVIASSN